jgi:hypothetical protein
MKWIATAFAALLLAVLTFTTEASADRMNGKGNCSGGVCTKVSCPARTCSKAGTSDAYDIRNCSAANCRK